MQLKISQKMRLIPYKIRTLGFLVRHSPSLRYFLEQLLRFIQNLFADHEHWIPESYVQVASDFEILGDVRVAYFIHVYHEDYIERIIDLANAARKYDFYITCSNENIIEELRLATASCLNVRQVICTPNRGRNFGPILVEYGKVMLTYEFIIHLHTKKSLHMGPEAAGRWSDESWGLFDPSKPDFAKLMKIMISNAGISLAFPLDLNITPPSSFTWGMNREIALNSLPLEHAPKPKGRFSFPAGGMFIARSENLRPLLDLDWSYDLFSLENGALDGTLQHAIERAVGIVTKSSHSRHLYFLVSKRMFTIDSNFLGSAA